MKRYVFATPIGKAWAQSSTGSWAGSRHGGVKPDLMATAKAITNGDFPFGAAMIADHITEVFESDTTGKA